MKKPDAYHDSDGKPIMAKSIVVYIDALATKTFWKSEPDRTKLEFVRDWVREFDEFRVGLDPYADDAETALSSESPRVVTFTDNVAVAIPLSPERAAVLSALAEGDLELGFEAANETHEALYWLMSVLFSLQIHVLILVHGHGRFFRGAVRVGAVYADRWTIIGDGLIDAVMGEEKQTVVPAIQLPDWMVYAYQLDSVFYSKSRDSTLYQTLARTEFIFDGEDYSFVFLNYLACPDAGEFELWRDEVMPAHAALISEALDSNLGKDVQFKYLWLAAYHNWVVVENGLNESSLVVLEGKLSAPDIVIDSLEGATARAKSGSASPWSKVKKCSKTSRKFDRLRRLLGRQQ